MLRRAAFILMEAVFFAVFAATAGCVVIYDQLNRDRVYFRRHCKPRRARDNAKGGPVRSTA